MTPPITTESSVPLTVVYAGWDGFQRNLLQAVAPLTAEQLALPLAPLHWPIGMHVQHILNDRIWWFHVWMGEGGDDIAAFMHWYVEPDGRELAVCALERFVSAERV